MATTASTQSTGSPIATEVVDLLDKYFLDRTFGGVDIKKVKAQLEKFAGEPQAVIDEVQILLDGVSAEITALKKDIRDLDKSVADATVMRKEELSKQQCICEDYGHMFVQLPAEEHDDSSGVIAIFE